MDVSPRMGLSKEFTRDLRPPPPSVNASPSHDTEIEGVPSRLSGFTSLDTLCLLYSLGCIFPRISSNALDGRPSSEISSPEPAPSHSVGEFESSEVLENLRGSSTPTTTTTTATTTTVTPSGLPADLALSPGSQGQREEEYPTASYYWDASTMAPLNAVSAVSNQSNLVYPPNPAALSTHIHITSPLVPGQDKR